MNTRARQRGLSIVELMVGIAIGLVIVAAALLTLTHHLRENRSLIVEARLMQDLRTASDLVAHDLRRAGYWNHAGEGVWHASGSPLQANPYTALNVSDEATSFSYARSETDSHDFAYRLRDGVIEMRIGNGNWQAMTDGGTLRVASFSITPHAQDIVLDGFCARPCAAGSSNTCPPRQQVRSFAVHIEAKAATNPEVSRTVQATVRLRNDALSGACPA
jgi:type IV pilus assembly protein PilW